jgi:hypothetical protein
MGKQRWRRRRSKCSRIWKVLRRGRFKVDEKEVQEQKQEWQEVKEKKMRKSQEPEMRKGKGKTNASEHNQDMEGLEKERQQDVEMMEESREKKKRLEKRRTKAAEQDEEMGDETGELEKMGQEKGKTKASEQDQEMEEPLKVKAPIPVTDGQHLDIKDDLFNFKSSKKGKIALFYDNPAYM